MSASISSRLRRAASIVLSARNIGIANALGTARDVYWERLATSLSAPRLILHNRIRLIFPSLGLAALRDLHKDRDALLSRGERGYRVNTNELGVDDSKWVEIAAAPEAVIGDIDQDGFVRSEVGALNGIPTVSAKEFVPRTRYGLKLVARNGTLAIRKDYRGNRGAFLREVHALDVLAQAGCNVPALLDVDFDQMQVEMSYIAGPVVREALADRGAVLRDRDVERHELADLSPKEQLLARIQEGRALLDAVADEAFIENLFHQLRIMHSLRLVWGDIKYGNVIIGKDSGEPFLIDFEEATYHPRLGDRTFRRLADRDIEKFNLHFGTDKLTTSRLRQRANAIPASDVYAPACFVAGISIGNLWDNQNGYGRWRFMLKNALPPIQGARVLDLGANNGFNSLQLLRSGASEVVAVELGSPHIEQGQFLRAAFEYSDCATYNFRYSQGNMKDIMTMDLGRFDFVMALCCIYYLDDDDIAALASHIATITNTFVLQCNTLTGIGRKDVHTYVKSTVEYARKILTGAGFSDIELTAPTGFSRPLLVGRRPY